MPNIFGRRCRVWGKAMWDDGKDERREKVQNELEEDRKLMLKDVARAESSTASEMQFDED